MPLGPYHTLCKACLALTTRRYAREHNGLCNPCVTGQNPSKQSPTREQRILDHGYQAYAREEGHYDVGDE